MLDIGCIKLACKIAAIILIVIGFLFSLIGIGTHSWIRYDANIFIYEAGLWKYCTKSFVGGWTCEFFDGVNDRKFNM